MNPSPGVRTVAEAMSVKKCPHFNMLYSARLEYPMEQVQLLRCAGEEQINEVKNEVLLLREKIRKLGDVNPAAVEEYDAIVERYNLLSTQKADLEKAMRDLTDTVEKINKVSRDRFERDYILRALARQQGNMSRTAEMLGVERSNLYRKMKGYGIAPSRRSEVDEDEPAK